MQFSAFVQKLLKPSPALGVGWKFICSLGICVLSSEDADYCHTQNTHIVGCTESIPVHHTLWS